jgi:hypothetical protein
VYANTNAIRCIWSRKDPLGTVASIDGCLRNEFYMILSFDGLDSFLRFVGSREGGKAQECEEECFTP